MSNVVADIHRKQNMFIQTHFMRIHTFLFVFGHLICQKPFRDLTLRRVTERGVRLIPDRKNRSGEFI